ncbi:MAG TPA: helix-turn-helix transcriptional regulator [Phycisphaerales bacterium]|nr:helix-turn-helix transcriptional regulator [Phycisphaerales bacterium]
MPRSNDIFAANVAFYRGERNLSQERLALACGVNKTAVSHWESGRSIPKGRVLDRLEDALDVPLAALFSPERVEKLAKSEPPKRREPTLREALRVVNAHAGDLVLKIRSKAANDEQE